MPVVLYFAGLVMMSAGLVRRTGTAAVMSTGCPLHFFLVRENAIFVLLFLIIILM